MFQYEFDQDRKGIKVSLGRLFDFPLEDSEYVMSNIIDILLEVRGATAISLAGTREYAYDSNQTKMLVEVAFAYEQLLEWQRNLKWDGICETCKPLRGRELQTITSGMVKRDPIGAYVKAKRLARKLGLDTNHTECNTSFINTMLLKIMQSLGGTQLLQNTSAYIAGYQIGDRSVYRKIFHPSMRPNFMFTRYLTLPPENAELLGRYEVNGMQVEIFKVPGKMRNIYHVTPVEFKLDEKQYNILDSARRYLAEHKPKEEEFANLDRIREIFFNIGKDIIRDIAKGQGEEMSQEEEEDLARILTRYTAGLGVLEILLADESIQDVFINSPIGSQPVFIYHSQFEECETNIIPTAEDAEVWATRFRIISGRPLDEANPVLDTEINVPGGRARVSVITRSLSPEGLGYALRRHRDEPWTYPLLIKNRAMNPLAAGLMWFLVDGARTLLIAGTRGAGKTSFLGATMSEIMKKYRVITLEDSVTGDSQIVYQRNGVMEKGTVGELIDSMIKKHGNEKIMEREILRKNPENIKVFSIGTDGKVKLSPVSAFIKHKTSKDIFEITTRTGRKIKVTGDHSLFTLGNAGSIEAVKTNQLNIDDYLLTPRILPLDGQNKDHIDILDHIENIEKGFLIGPSVKKCIEDNWDLMKTLVNNRSQRSRWRRLGMLPISFIKKNLPKYEFGHELYYTSSRSQVKVPRIIPLTNELMEFFGLWLADGSYDKHSVILSVIDENSRNCARKVAQYFNASVKMHSDGVSIMLNASALRSVMKVIGFTGNAYTKKIPAWVYQLERDKIISIIRGIFTGDGHTSDKEVMLSLCSEELVKDIQTLLLSFGIIFRIGKKRKSDKTYPCRISALGSLKEFEKIGYLDKTKNYRLKTLCNKKSTHDSSDVIPFSEGYKKILHNNSPTFNYSDYISRGNNIGRQKMLSIARQVTDPDISSHLFNLAQSDILWDQIREIKRLESTEGYVYDVSVPEFENFVCENILAHNTLELPVEFMRNIGYNIERLKSRSVITKLETELPADEALRAALRLGDSALIVGEVRSTEAKALYEAMRVGALANVVAGTIHGDSPYGVYDRIVNDLGVPTTSFKATDVIAIANRLRSSDGTRTFRRMTEITEVRKHWKNDPADEGGFVPLMEYSAKEDDLKPTQTLLNGESYVLNDIARRVREWSGNWEVVWDNILLRSKIKEALVVYSDKLEMPQLLEARFTTVSNDQFYGISEAVKRELGAMDSNEIFLRWNDWMKTQVKTFKMAKVR